MLDPHLIPDLRSEFLSLSEVNTSLLDIRSKMRIKATEADKTAISTMLTAEKQLKQALANYEKALVIFTANEKAEMKVVIENTPSPERF